MTIKRMDDVLLVVDDLEAVKAFFLDLGESTVEGPLVGDLIGLKDLRATLVMLRPPNGHGGIDARGRAVRARRRAGERAWL